MKNKKELSYFINVVQQKLRQAFYLMVKYLKHAYQDTNGNKDAHHHHCLLTFCQNVILLAILANKKDKKKIKSIYSL